MIKEDYKMRLSNYFLSLFLIIVLTGCFQHFEAPIDSDNEELFDWKTVSPLSLEVKVPEIADYLDQFGRTVQIFTSDSMETSSLISTGVSYPSQPYNITLDLPASVNEIYVKVIEPTGKQSKFRCDVANNVTGNIVIDASRDDNYPHRVTKSEDAPDIPAITIPQQFDYTITESFPQKLEHGKTYHIPAGAEVLVDNAALMFSGWITKEIATIYVEGKLIFAPSTYDVRNRHLVVMNGGEIYAQGDLRLANFIDRTTPALYVEEEGVVNVVNEFRLQENHTLINKGFINCDIYLGYVNAVFHNAGRFFISKKFSPLYFDKSTFYLYPGSLLECQGDAHMGLATMVMYEDAIIYFNNFYTGVNKDKPELEPMFVSDQQEKKALVIVNSVRTKSFYLEGNIEMWIKNYNHSTYRPFITNENNSVFTKGAFLVEQESERVYHIDRSLFNRGYGVLSHIEDMDNDGIPADQDIDDQDPTVAYRSYFPSSTEYATIMFEDLWPWTGDYDMNDLVMDIRVEWTTNSDNQVAYMDVKWKLRAAGSTRHLAFALQLDDVSASGISGVTNTKSLVGNLPFDTDGGIEKNVTKAVIPFYNSVEDVFGKSFMVNTIQGIYTASNYETIRVRFSSPVSRERLTMDKLNFFLVSSDAQNIKRTNEIHMPTFSMTEKGIMVESSELSKKDPYLHTTGMMWGFMVPKSIPHPVEEASIEEIYPDFKEWYTSKGEQKKDWFNNTASAEKIFQEPVQE